MKGIVLAFVVIVSTSLFGYAFEIESFEHDMYSRDYFNPVKNGEIYFAVSFSRDSIGEAFIILNDEEYKMSFLRNSGRKTFYRIRLFPENNSEYFFKVSVGDQNYFLGTNKSMEVKDISPFHINFDELTVSYFSLPDWSKGIVYYQIFPERFKNGDNSNDPVNVQDWFYTEDSDLGSEGFFGGDLQGIIDKMDYLEELGIGAIYLNPVFESISSHKYDTEDYLKIDDNFGDVEVFKELVDSASENNIKIILDGVFNHTGKDFWAFQDIIKNGSDSEYTDWYFIKGFPIEEDDGKAINYIGWNGFSHMPKLNVQNESVKKYIEEVVEFYDEMGICGWRLDVANEVPPKFWIEFFRPEVKELNPESIIVGEIWGDAKTYLMGDMFDSVMNYPFREALLNYLTKSPHSAKIFANLTSFYLNSYPPQILDSLWNIIESHDTSRILSSTFGNLDLMKLAVVIQMTFKGSPVIYYGSEIGLDGFKDPYCRKPMIWDEDEQNLDLLNFYKSLIDLRNNSEALKYGDLNILNREGKVLMYSRTLNDQEIIVIVSPSDISEDVNINFYGNYNEYFSGKKYSFSKDESLKLAPMEHLILIKQ